MGPGPTPKERPGWAFAVDMMKRETRGRRKPEGKQHTRKHHGERLRPSHLSPFRPRSRGRVCRYEDVEEVCGVDGRRARGSEVVYVDRSTKRVRFFREKEGNVGERA
jgi:hypothetical protein